MSSEGFSRIVVPVDFSAPSETAWALARRVAGLSNAELILTHVVPETPLYSEGPFSMDRVAAVYATQRAWAEGELRKWADVAVAEGRRVRVVVTGGVPHDQIVAVASNERADLIVIATHGRGGLDRALLGSIADRVIRLAPCPVLSVRAPE